MLKRILKLILKIFLGLLAFIAVVFFLAYTLYHFWPDQFTDDIRTFPIFPDKLIDTLRFFPHYNPFGKQLEDKIPTLSVLNDSGQNIQGPSNLDQYANQLQNNSLLIKATLNITDAETREVIVYLPKGYDPKNNQQRYPVLYLLHGSPGHASDWIIQGNAKQVLDNKITNGKIRPLIAVFPDGNGSDNKDSEYINSASEGPNEDFVYKTVVNYVDNNFFTLAQPEYRAIGGLSEGGFGSLNIGLKHQDIFGYILSISGYGDLPVTVLTKGEINGSSQIIHDNSPNAYIPELKDKTVKVLLVTDNQHGPILDARQTLTLLTNNGFGANMLIFNGHHDWGFWIAHLPDSIDWLAQYWKS